MRYILQSLLHENESENLVSQICFDCENTRTHHEIFQREQSVFVVFYIWTQYKHVVLHGVPVLEKYRGTLTLKTIRFCIFLVPVLH